MCAGKSWGFFVLFGLHSLQCRLQRFLFSPLSTCLQNILFLVNLELIIHEITDFWCFATELYIQLFNRILGAKFDTGVLYIWVGLQYFSYAHNRSISFDFKLPSGLCLHVRTFSLFCRFRFLLGSLCIKQLACTLDDEGLHQRENQELIFELDSSLFIAYSVLWLV